MLPVLKNKILLPFVQTYQKTKQVPYIEMSVENAQKRKESLYMDKSRDNNQKRCVYKRRNAARSHSLFFFHKRKSLRSATSF